MLFKFKKTAQETAERQKEKLISTVNLPNEDVPSSVQLFLACDDEMVSTYFSFIYNLLFQI